MPWTFFLVSATRVLISFHQEISPFTVPEVSSYSSFGNRTLEGKLGKSHAFIQQTTLSLFDDFFFSLLPKTVA